MINIGLKKIYNDSDDYKFVIKTTNRNNPKVFEVNFSMWLSPNFDAEVNEYNGIFESVKNNTEYNAKQGLRKSRFQSRYIVTTDMTTANLKKDFKKYVSMSFYIRQRYDDNMMNVKTAIEDIKRVFIPVADTFVRNFKESDFQVKKKKGT